MRLAAAAIVLLGMLPIAAEAEVVGPSRFVAGHPTISSEHLAADQLPPTTVGYRISARLDPPSREIAGTVELTWRNPGTRPIAAVPIHLYLNAFSHKGTTWMRGGTGRIRFDERDYTNVVADPWGYTDLTEVRQRTSAAVAGDPGTVCAVAFVQPDDGNSLDRTLAEITLAEPLPPGGLLELKLTFAARLPIPMARTGGIRDYYHAGQWYPKLGMYEQPGVRGARQGRWAARQFHGSTEFYAEFADFDATIDVPLDYAVVATGAEVPLAAGLAPATGRSLHRFTQRAIHDFTFVAARGLHVETHPHRPTGGGPEIAIIYVTQEGVKENVARMRSAAETTLDVLGERVGPYPYRTLTIVQPPYFAMETAGMEYQTVVTDLPGDPLMRLLPDGQTMGTIGHELAHNYFQGLVASDEQREAFLDEGFAEYWGWQATAAMKAKGGAEWGRLLGLRTDDVASAQGALAGSSADIDEPLTQMPTNLFYDGTAGPQVYLRTRLLLLTAERRFGRPAVDRIFAAYFRRWRFRHPGAADFAAVVRELGPKALTDFLDEGLRARRVPDYRIDEAETAPFAPPIGLLPTEGGRELLSRVDAGHLANRERGLDVATLAGEDAGVSALVTAPGWVDGDERREGTTARIVLTTDRVGPLAGWKAEEHVWHTSTVRLRGPGWRNLPVVIEFRFTDGAVAREVWDGRATWRQYEFTRTAPLAEVRLDPDDLLPIDAWPDNNGRRVWQPDRTLAHPVAVWLGFVGQWLTLAGGWL